VTLSAIPTNVITGFLGVGKTTAILHLLKNKPADERWAVLVNEFGEVGVDGSLFSGGNSEASGVFIREVPGGCMCCAAGLPMQIALNMLLSRSKPQRLLIEPTGLGHPHEVMSVLSAEHYKDVLNLNTTLTLPILLSQIKLIPTARRTYRTCKTTWLNGSRALPKLFIR